ncbi:MAG: DUF4468 domain-containing protein [Bacteroidaceae bacterium]|nr:DUF4468 domain-containing protein [Bacteroidaceae bacterium]
MRKSLLSIAISFVALTASAGGVVDEYGKIFYDSNDPRYGVGAVKEENGKVVFNYDLSCDKDKESAFDIVEAWMRGRFVQPAVVESKIVKNNKDKSVIAVNSTETIVFKNTPLVTDFTKILYTMTVSVQEEGVKVSFTDISYAYNENRDGVVATFFPAEDWITDKESMNKKQTKFLKKTGKFRVCTIDLFTNISNALQKALDE